MDRTDTSAADGHAPKPACPRIPAIAILGAGLALIGCSAKTEEMKPSAPSVVESCRAVYAQPTALERLTRAPAPPAPASPKPAKGAVYRDLDGTCAVRVTQHDVEEPKTFARNDYSRRQPFNADDTRLLVYGSGGEWFLYDANTLELVERLQGPAGDAEIQWDPVDPNLLYYMPINGGMSIERLDIRTNRSTRVADFDGKLPWPNVERLWTKSEGSPSSDNRYWGLLAETEDFKILGFVVYDLVEHRVVGTRSTKNMPDHVSMTPSGRWFESSGDDGTWAWSPDFTQKKKLHHTTEHSDIAIGPDGHDDYVSIDFQSDKGDVFFVDIDTCPAVPADADPGSTPECPRTVLFPTYDNGSHASFHFSGKAYGKPGWVLVSTYGSVPSRTGVWPWFTNRLFALELTALPRAFAVGHHHSNGESYWAEPQATPDRNFTRLVFNSNWDKPRDPKLARDAADDVDDYMIVLPGEALPPAR
jgi:hypothetical protein